MVREVLDTYTDKPGVREVTLKYDKNNPSDKIILDKIYAVLKEQPRCENCVNYRVEGNFCGFNAYYCELHGNLVAFDHPHHDLDGSKCSDYKRVKDNG